MLFDLFFTDIEMEDNNTYIYFSDSLYFFFFEFLDVNICYELKKLRDEELLVKLDPIYHCTKYEYNSDWLNIIMEKGIIL